VPSLIRVVAMVIGSVSGISVTLAHNRARSKPEKAACAYAVHRSNVRETKP